MTQERNVDDGRPVETVREREVIRTLQEPEGEKVYDPGSALPDRFRSSAPRAPSYDDTLAEVATRVRAQESWVRTQSAILRDIDLRLTGLESGNRAYAAVHSVERTTWWALWGILMLIIGSALAIVLILIFTSAAH